MILLKYVKIIRPAGRIIFLFLFLVTLQVSGQKYYFDQYSVSEGLAQSTVYCILQDMNDIFWLGTQAGVSRFDGSEFINYTAEDGLARGGVRAICQDAAGNIWFGHEGGGITRFNGDHFEKFEGAELIFKSNITTMTEDLEGRLWIGSEQTGAAVIYNPTAPIRELKYEQYLGKRLSDRVFGSFLSKEGDLYFITDPMVKKFDPDSSKFDNLVLNGIPRYFATTSMLKDSRDNLWFGTYHGGLYRYDPGKDNTEMFDLVKLGMTSNWVSSLYEDHNGNIWVGTWGGGVARIEIGRAHV